MDWKFTMLIQNRIIAYRPQILLQEQCTDITENIYLIPITTLYLKIVSLLHWIISMDAENSDPSPTLSHPPQGGLILFGKDLLTTIS